MAFLLKMFTRATPAEAQPETLASADGTLYAVESNGRLQPKSSEATVTLVRDKPLQYTFRVLMGTTLALTSPFSRGLQMQFDKKSRTITWVLLADGAQHRFRFVFADAACEQQFRVHAAVALSEAVHQQTLAQIAADAQDDVEDAADADADAQSQDNDERIDNDDNDDDEVDVLQREEKQPSPNVEDYDEREEKRVEKREEPKAQHSKSQLAVGTALNRTYVSRDSQLDVLKYNADDELEFVTKLKLTTRDGDAFAPSATMLTQQDSKMLMLNPDRLNSVYCMDLERGQVVEEWKAGPDFVLRGIAPTQKYAQRSADKLVVATTPGGLYTLDPRARQHVVQKLEYNRAPKLNCVATTGDGHLVVGSEKGAIRLFTKVGQRAKTELPGLGDATTGMDTTEDGKWILATTQRYIMLIPTLLADDAPGSKTAFQRVLPAGTRPRPLKLQLDRADLDKYGIKNVNFSPARFNVGDGSIENWIVSSTGPFIITWDFGKIRRQGPTACRAPSYKITKTVDQVIADQFRFGLDDQVVASTHDGVVLEKRA